MGNDHETSGQNPAAPRTSSGRGTGSNADPEDEKTPSTDRSPAPGTVEAAGASWDAETDPAASSEIERTGEGAHER
jgi:hypothetical protein